MCRCCICQVWKTLLPIFCLPLPHLPPESAETGPTSAVADIVDFKAMAAEQNCCAETQHLLGGSSLQLAFRQAGNQHLVSDVSTGIFRPIVLQKFIKETFFSIFTKFHIWGGSPLGVWCLLGLSGEGSPPTSSPGCEPASTGSRPRFIATCACSPSQSPSYSDVFLISTLIWWDPYSIVAVAISFSLSFIAHPNGWK